MSIMQKSLSKIWYLLEYYNIILLKIRKFSKMKEWVKNGLVSAAVVLMGSFISLLLVISQKKIQVLSKQKKIKSLKNLKTH